MRARTTKTIPFQGMNEDDPWTDNPGFAARVEQMEHDPAGFWRTMPGVLQVCGADWVSPGALIGLVWFQPRPSQRFLVVEEVTGAATSTLYWIPFPEDGTKVALATRRRTPGRPAASQFVQDGRWLYHFNGIEAPIRWDGETVHRMGFASVPPPTVGGSSQGFTSVDVAAADLDATAPDYVVPEQRGLGPEAELDGEPERWVAGYALTLLNDRGQESHPSAIVIASGTNTNESTAGGSIRGRSAVRVSVPVLPREVVGCRLWRTPTADGATSMSELYLVASFPSTGGGFDFVDNTPDNELGQLLLPDSAGPVPLGVRCAAFHHESMWVAVDNRVWRSRAGVPEVFPPGQQYSVGGSGTGMVVAMLSVPRGLLILSTRGIFMAKGNPQTGYQIETVSDRHEVVGPRAVALIDELGGVALLTTSGPVVVKGTLEDDQPTHVAPLRGCRKTWRELVSPTSLHAAVVVHRPEVNEVWWNVPVLGETRPSFGFVLHYAAGGWSFRPSWKFAAAVGYAGRTWLASWDTDEDTSVGVFILSRGGFSLSLDDDAGPPDPSVPSTATSEAFPLRAGGVTVYMRDITGDPVVGLYETGVVRAVQAQSPQAVEVLGIPTGGTRAFDAQVRYDQRVHFAPLDDQGWRDSVLTQQSDLDGDTQKRPRWGEATWDAAGMWVEAATSAFRLTLPRQAWQEYQFRLRGLDLRIAGMRVEMDPSSPERRREES